MGNLFNPNNKFFTLLSKVFDMVFLSLVFLVFCIPVITIGPACTALYYAVVKVIRRERSYVFREFLKSFKLNFKRGALSGIILTIAYIILIVDIMTTYHSMSGNLMNQVLFGIYIAFSVIIAGITVYIFPVLSRFDLTLKQLFKTVFFMLVKHLPSTILMILIFAATIIGVIVFPLSMIIVPAFLTLIQSFLLERILKIYTTQEQEADEENKRDEWYLE